MKKPRIGQRVWLKANKAEGWPRERVKILGFDKNDTIAVVEAEDDIMEITLNQIEETK